MTTLPGSTVGLLSQWYSYAGGPLVDLDANPSIQIVRVATGAIVLPSTNTGVLHLATGTYSYAWVTSSSYDAGEYLVTWSGTVSGSAVVATEIVTLDSLGLIGGGSSPCGAWPVIWGNCDLTTISPAITGVAVQAASEVLWALTGRRYGICQLTIRPCSRRCSGFSWGSSGNGLVFGSWWEYGTYPRPLFFDGVWSNLTCGNGCPDDSCSCSFVSEAILPEPVVSINSVKVDGVVLSTAGYRVDDYRKLVRLGGNQWPLCNDLNKADSEVGTWSVTVSFGEAVPILGQMAVGELACQFAKLLNGNEDCELPSPVQQLVRQGVTMDFLDPNKVFSDGKVGLYLSDLFISSVNPFGLASRSEIYDIDGETYRIPGTS